MLASVPAPAPEWAIRPLALLAPFPALLLAVSGGPDSVALMLLIARYLRDGARRIEVATVDHGLRAESAQEAAQVGDWARALRLPHHLLTWRGPKPATRIQERARAARYRLLADCADAIGGAPIVTAHHADDQAETILFRLCRGSGVAGLSGMSLRTDRDDSILLRPFLSIPKATLTAYCQAAGHDFFSDPSNFDGKYARARLRAMAPILAAQGLDRDALLRLGARAARAEEALVQCTETLRRKAIRHVDDISAQFDAASLADAPPEILQRLVAQELARLAPGAPQRLERLERLVAALRGPLSAGGQWRATMAGLLVESRAGALTLRPAPPRRRADQTSGGAYAQGGGTHTSLGKKPDGA